MKPAALAKTRVRDAEATRARILKAAVREFARHGFAGARGERVARAARSSERMVYYYFTNKEGLFRAALETVYASLRDAERALRLDDQDPLAALESFCRFVWDYYLKHPEFIGLVNTENLQQARHLRRSPRLGELVSPVVGLLAELLDRGRREGVIRADLDPAQLYVSIASLGYFYLSNQHTLSAVLGRELLAPDHLQAHWRSAAEMIRRYVAVPETLIQAQ
ncbi:MAG TPA: TetR/AcrR family transcriptional regulator [Burkholderiaceae bacterium]|nr:TetR/AcrR family transcriptional regulator [Burkholderiaceae bacterium]